MGWVQAVIAGIKALPELLELLKKLGQAVKDKNLSSDILRIQEAINEVEKVKTLDAAKHAIGRLRDALNKL